MLLLNLNYVISQQDSYSWELVNSYKINNGETWAVDLLENIYISNGEMIHKYDSTGNRIFSQSIKSLGNAKTVIPINSMKLLHFSEEQQTICYFDNTLSFLDDCIDLSIEGINSAELICASYQPNKVWVVDNLNLTLHLLSLSNKQQSQIVRNLRGILDINNITQIIESENMLFLLDITKGIYILDLYASLIEFIDQKNILQIDVNETTIFTLSDTNLFIKNYFTTDELSINLPMNGIFELKYKNDFFYFRVNQRVYKYKLQLNK